MLRRLRSFPHFVLTISRSWNRRSDVERSIDFGRAVPNSLSQLQFPPGTSGILFTEFRLIVNERWSTNFPNFTVSRRIYVLTIMLNSTNNIY